MCLEAVPSHSCIRFWHGDLDRRFKVKQPRKVLQKTFHYSSTDICSQLSGRRSICWDLCFQINLVPLWYKYQSSYRYPPELGTRSTNCASPSLTDSPKIQLLLSSPKDETFISGQPCGDLSTSEPETCFFRAAVRMHGLVVINIRSPGIHLWVKDFKFSKHHFTWT
jgi:hypothetical protein